MQINPVSPQAVAMPAAKSAPAAPAMETPKPAAKDSAEISQRARDLAAQLTGKTAQEEAKESPVVEMNEEQGQVKD
jgi:hypothetical protein